MLVGIQRQQSFCLQQGPKKRAGEDLCLCTQLPLQNDLCWSLEVLIVHRPVDELDDDLQDTQPLRLKVPTINESNLPSERGACAFTSPRICGPKAR